MFQKLDYDKSGDISILEFKSYVLNDGSLAKQLKKNDEMFRETASNFIIYIINVFLIRSD